MSCLLLSRPQCSFMGMMISHDMLLGRWRLSLELFGRVFMEDVGAEPGSKQRETILVNPTTFARKINPTGLKGDISVGLTWSGCSATTSILCSAYFLTYSGWYLSRPFLLAEVNSEGQIHGSKHSVCFSRLRMADQLP
ncbi:hypothetical protein CCH79_00011994 [Gambusia affinis]|uniref:Uncharacterized protein n=1 Tax=Gambusia affinis TaxID=33528 RepID=A0A315W988_GAMAF|nr:hypothetical protein CCH79_00011994 [Gambusia affinis]